MSDSTGTRSRFLEKATELRMIIAILFAVYGVVCLIWSGFTTPQELVKAAGINVNLWAGIGMVVVALLFFFWAMLKPLSVDDSAKAEVSDSEQGPSSSR